MRTRIACAMIGFSLLLAGGPARADAIDGAWCRTGGLRLMIDGPRIVTPAGITALGDYSRHAFSYVAPAGDRGAGATIAMVLLNEDRMELRAGTEDPAETWLRCGPPVS